MVEPATPVENGDSGNVNGNGDGGVRGTVATRNGSGVLLLSCMLCLPLVFGVEAADGGEMMMEADLDIGMALLCEFVDGVVIGYGDGLS
jgi:ascorbate-specific PTS system EIIC-type component UlaA